MGKPFARANALMALAAAAITLHGSNFGAARAALDALGPYTSRGHGGKRAHRMTGITRVRRQALKARNVKANRRAHRA